MQIIDRHTSIEQKEIILAQLTKLTSLVNNNISKLTNLDIKSECKHRGFSFVITPIQNSCQNLSTPKTFHFKDVNTPTLDIVISNSSNFVFAPRIQRILRSSTKLKIKESISINIAKDVSKNKTVFINE